MRKRLWTAHAIWIALCVGMFVLAEVTTLWGVSSGLRGVVVLHRISNGLRDLKLRYQGYRPPSHPIVIVDVDNASLEQIGRWPWRRDYIGELINQVFEHGASYVGLDIVFSDPQESVPEELREMLKSRKLEGMLDAFDFDKLLAATFQKHRGRLATSWMSNAICRPSLSAGDECPVLHPEAVAALPRGWERFAVETVEQSPGFTPEKTALRSAVTVMPNLPMFDEVTDRMGFVNSAFDFDGIIRRTSPVLLVGGKFYPSLPVALAQAVRGDSLRVRTTSDGYLAELTWKKSGKRIPVSPMGLSDIRFLGPERHFPYVSARDIFATQGTRDLAATDSPLAALKGAVVLIGISALAVGDLVPTPFEPVHPGVEVHATVLENLLSDSLIEVGGPIWVLMLALVMGVFGFVAATIGAKWDAVPALVSTIGAMLVVAFIDFQLFFLNGRDLATGFWYLQMLGSLGITVVGKYIIEQNDRKFVRSAFAKYVAPAVVDKILADPKQLTLGGQRQPLTVLFSDIRGFTTLSEKLDARAVSEFLNEYLERQTEVIFAHGGTLDKYIGDAIMAFWGAPLDQPDHALRACRAAIAMAETLEEDRPRYRQRYGIDVFMGIGLHTGEVNVGNMGSARSFSYTAIGDNVNLASRLEGATKHFGVEILTTRHTLDSVAAAGLVSELPAHRYLADLRVKGKEEAVAVVQLFRRRPDVEALLAFQQGVEQYRKRKWVRAIPLFEKAAKALRPGGDVVSQKYLKLCRGFAKKAPARGWDPAWELTEK